MSLSLLKILYRHPREVLCAPREECETRSSSPWSVISNECEDDEEHDVVLNKNLMDILRSLYR
jgi:hypothetical protein